MAAQIYGASNRMKNESYYANADLAEEVLSIIPSAISQEECRALIDLSESVGYAPATIEGRLDGPQGFNVSAGRYNDRSAVEDTALADVLWNRLHRRVPALINGRKVIGLNERLRFYRYGAGQNFSPHTDGYYLRDNGERSLLTMILYLNDDYSGGEAFFLKSETLIAPQTGTLLLFTHTLWHEGRAVTAGQKYILRTDVMYEPEA
jgi:predicted 2-oxoglutarate/Fe(II)-dependent dioxygenase YbiX